MTSRTGRAFARLPRPTLYSVAELALLILIAVQAARLFWVLATPVGPVGDWRPQSALAAPGDDAALANFDPFFRLSAAGPAVVTSLDLKLYGTREDRASGRGSAIIALPDGRQMSFAVGEEIMPGVTLAQVAFDNVTINRGGTPEQIFLDQSPPAQTVGETPAPTAPPAAGQQQPSAAAPAPAPPGQAIGFQPRLAGGRINGIIVSPGGDGGQAFRAAGFAPGDVIVAVNGQRVTSLEQARAAMGAGREVDVTVDRGGRAVPMRVRLNQ